MCTARAGAGASRPTTRDLPSLNLVLMNTWVLEYLELEYLVLSTAV